MNWTLGHIRLRRLDDMPGLVTPGAKEVALITLFAREQDFALMPITEAMQVLSKLDDWSGKFLAADEVHPHFNWKTQPFKSYASFEDFYDRELRETWRSWTELQATWSR
jgi:hypothetical protein